MLHRAEKNLKREITVTYPGKWFIVSSLRQYSYFVVCVTLSSWPPSPSFCIVSLVHILVLHVLHQVAFCILYLHNSMCSFPLKLTLVIYHLNFLSIHSASLYCLLCLLLPPSFCHLSSTPCFCWWILKVLTHSFCSQKSAYHIRSKQTQQSHPHRGCLLFSCLSMHRTLCWRGVYTGSEGSPGAAGVCACVDWQVTGTLCMQEGGQRMGHYRGHCPNLMLAFLTLTSSFPFLWNSRSLSQPSQNASDCDI